MYCIYIKRLWRGPPRTELMREEARGGGETNISFHWNSMSYLSVRPHIAIGCTDADHLGWIPREHKSARRWRVDHHPAKGVLLSDLGSLQKQLDQELRLYCLVLRIFHYT